MEINDGFTPFNGKKENAQGDCSITADFSRKNCSTPILNRRTSEPDQQDKSNIETFSTFWKSPSVPALNICKDSVAIECDAERRDNSVLNFQKARHQWAKLRSAVHSVAVVRSEIKKRKQCELQRENSFLRRFSTRSCVRKSVGSNADSFEENGHAYVFDYEWKDSCKNKSVHTTIRPDSAIMFYWTFVVSLSVLYNLWVTIAREAFREIQDGCEVLWFSLDAIADVIYMCDIIVQFRTGFYDQGLMVENSFKLASHYLHSGYFYVDVISIIPYIFVIVSYLIGVFIFATIVGQVGSVISNRNISRQEFERLVDSAKTYMRRHNVPKEMRKRVLRWYDYVWERRRVNGRWDINNLGLLPDKLKTELAIHVNLQTLRKVKIFNECQPEFLHDLVLKMKAHVFTPGDVICRYGEIAREMFIIADGVVEVISENGTVLTNMNPGDFFGEIGILNLDGGVNRRTADVRSVGYSELFVLSKNDVLMALKDYPDAEKIMKEYGKKRLDAIKNLSTSATLLPKQFLNEKLNQAQPVNFEDEVSKSAMCDCEDDQDIPTIVVEPASPDREQSINIHGDCAVECAVSAAKTILVEKWKEHENIFRGVIRVLEVEKANREIIISELNKKIRKLEKELFRLKRAAMESNLSDLRNSLNPAMQSEGTLNIKGGHFYTLSHCGKRPTSL